MRKGHGEMRILKRIKRAASQNEVISVNERKYVESLMEKFLRASLQEPPKSIEEPIIQQAKPAPQEHVVVKKRQNSNAWIHSRVAMLQVQNKSPQTR